MVYLTKYYRVLSIEPNQELQPEFIQNIIVDDILEITDDLLSGDCLLAHRFKIKNSRTGEIVFVINSLDSYLSRITYEQTYDRN